MSFKFKAYPVTFTLAVVGIGATGNGVPVVQKITDGDFRLEAFSFTAFDANGVVIPNPNINIKMKTGSYNLLSDDTPVACLQRADQPRFNLPEPIDFKRNEDISFIATGQSGNQAVRLVALLIGGEDDGKPAPKAATVAVKK